MDARGRSLCVKRKSWAGKTFSGARVAEAQPVFLLQVHFHALASETSTKINNIEKKCDLEHFEVSHSLLKAMNGRTIFFGFRRLSDYIDSHRSKRVESCNRSSFFIGL